MAIGRRRTAVTATAMAVTAAAKAARGRTRLAAARLPPAVSAAARGVRAQGSCLCSSDHARVAATASEYLLWCLRVCNTCTMLIGAVGSQVGAHGSKVGASGARSVLSSSEAADRQRAERIVPSCATAAHWCATCNMLAVDGSQVGAYESMVGAPGARFALSNPVAADRLSRKRRSAVEDLFAELFAVGQKHPAPGLPSPSRMLVLPRLDPA